MSTTQESEPLPGLPVWESEPADPFDVFLVEWAQDTAKRSIPFLNETLRTLVTLNVALLGGGLVLLREGVAPGWARAAALLAFLLSLAAAFRGVLPFEGSPHLQMPAEIRAHKAAALRHKRRWLWLSSWLIVAGFAAAVAGVAVSLFG
jgi:hypothetical protein